MSDRGRQRAFVVEDNDQVRRLSVACLTRLGFEVTESSDARSARESFQPGVYDLLFSDVILPDGNGYSLAEEFVERDPALKVLMTSGYVGVAGEQLSQTARDWPLLSKPFRFDELKRAITELLAPAGS